MARVTKEEVRAILTAAESAALTDDQLDAAIAAATIMVDQLASAECHTTESLKAVELYLSADIAVRTSYGGSMKEEKIGDSAEKRNTTSDGKTGYWGTALMLDCSGNLVDFGKRSVVFQPFGAA